MGFNVKGFKDRELDEKHFLDPDSKNTLLMPRFPGTDKKSVLFYHREKANLMKIMKNDLFKSPLGFATVRNSIFFRMFKINLQRLFEAGITNIFNIEQVRIELVGNYKVTEANDEPKVLTMQDLKAGFIIWLVAVSGAILVFFGEIVFFHCSLFINKARLKFKSKIEKIKIAKSRPKRKKRKIIKIKKLRKKKKRNSKGRHRKKAKKVERPLGAKKIKK